MSTHPSSPSCCCVVLVLVLSLSLSPSFPSLLLLSSCFDSLMYWMNFGKKNKDYYFFKIQIIFFSFSFLPKKVFFWLFCVCVMGRRQRFTRQHREETVTACNTSLKREHTMSMNKMMVSIRFVFRERERERERAVWTYSLFLLISTLWIVCGESQLVCLCDVM